MELDLDPELSETLAEEADERGFESSEAYVEWLLAHRESILTPPGEQLEARLERVEGQLERLRRTLEDGVTANATADSGAGGVGDAPAGGDWFDEDRRSGGTVASETGGDLDAQATEPPDEKADEDTGVSEFAYSDELEPPAEESTAEQPVEEEPEDAADDDEIAQALADVELEDEEQEQSEDGEDDE